MVAIGGVGGSGTRVLAQILEEAGYFIGNDLNESNDNLLFTLLFKRENILFATDAHIKELWSIFMKIMTQDSPLTHEQYQCINELASRDRTLHPKEWLQERVKFLNHQNTKQLLAFKEPNSHIVIERLWKIEPTMKFIYVYRNGLDMAYSSNQNQLKMWGDIMLNEKNIAISPKNSLRYWVSVHKRIVALQQSNPNNVLLLDFDALCLHKEAGLETLKTFLQYPISSHFSSQLIKRPSSIGRHKHYPLSEFDEDDLTYVNDTCESTSLSIIKSQIPRDPSSCIS